MGIYLCSKFKRLLLACFVVEIIQCWSFANPLWPFINVIETSMSIICTMHISLPSCQVSMPYSLNIVRYTCITIIVLVQTVHGLLWSKHFLLWRLGCVCHFSVAARDCKNIVWLVSYIIDLTHDMHQLLLSSHSHLPKACLESRHWPDCVHEACMVCSCDHNSKRRLLKISDWSRTYHGLSVQLCNAYSLLSRTFSSAKPLWPSIKVKVINTTMSICAMHKSTVMPSLKVWMS